jgi:Phage integrase family
LKAWGWKQTRQPEPHGPRTIWVKARPDALDPLTPHEARHCAASYMIAADMDWKKITEFLGHSDVRTTYNRYGKVVPEDLGPAAAELDDYFERTRARLGTSREAGGKTGRTVTGFRPPRQRYSRVRRGFVVRRTRSASSSGGRAYQARTDFASGPGDLGVRVDPLASFELVDQMRVLERNTARVCPSCFAHQIGCLPSASRGKRTSASAHMGAARDA